MPVNNKHRLLIALINHVQYDPSHMQRIVTNLLLFSAFVMCVPVAHAQEAVFPGDLIKASGPAVYYYYGNRYAYPNEDVYKSWYTDFSKVKTVSDAFLASVPLAGNVQFKSGVNMIKLTTDPKVYFVGKKDTLHWIPNETAAASLYGSDWATDIRDVNDAFFVNYTLGAPLTVEESTSISDLLDDAVYTEHISAVADVVTAAPNVANPFTSVASFTFGPLQDIGYAGTSTQGALETKALVEQLSSGWAKQVDFELTLFATSTLGYLMNFTQPRGNTVAHRSVGVARLLTTEEQSVIQVYEIVPAADIPLYPGTITHRYRTGGGLTVQEGAVTVSKDVFGEAIVAAAKAKGWNVVLERRNAALDSFFVDTYEWLFQKPGQNDWLVVHYRESGFARALYGDVSGVSLIHITL